jgi:hypothetical protein
MFPDEDDLMRISPGHSALGRIESGKRLIKKFPVDKRQKLAN